MKHNVRHLDNVITLPVALGKETTELEYFASDDSRNLGGGSFYPISSQVHLSRGKLPIMSPREELHKYDIRDIDLIKIDTEGAEHDILTSFPAEVISRVSAIVGELHGSEDQKLISYLSRWFDIEQTNNQRSFVTLQSNQQAMPNKSVTKPSATRCVHHQPSR